MHWKDAKQKLWASGPLEPYQAAERLLRMLRMTDPPFDPFDIATQLGVRFREMHAPGLPAGMLMSNEAGDANVYFRAADTREQKRFTMAHELGHLMLHPTGLAFHDTMEPSRAPREVEANSFATSLLMPWDRVKLVAQQENFSIKRLARHFQVTEAMMERRLVAVYSGSFA